MKEEKDVKYFKMNYDDLIKCLKTEKTTVIYKALTSLALRNLDLNALQPLKHIAQSATTMKNRKLAFKLLQYNFPDHIDQLVFTKNSKIGYVYFIQENFTYTTKIGRSHNLEDRLRIFISDFPFNIKLLHYIKTDNYEQIELEFHKHYKSKRVNGEWFLLEEEEITNLKNGNYPSNILKLIKQIHT